MSEFKDEVIKAIGERMDRAEEQLRNHNTAIILLCAILAAIGLIELVGMIKSW